MQVALLWASGIFCMVGGLFWTGLYGFPHFGPLGLVLFVAGGVSVTALVALGEPPGQNDNRPPQEPAQDQNGG